LSAYNVNVQRLHELATMDLEDCPDDQREEFRLVEELERAADEAEARVLDDGRHELAEVALKLRRQVRLMALLCRLRTPGMWDNEDLVEGEKWFGPLNMVPMS
jgi:hypothetical protein